jgi:hypothetical protein
VTVRRTRNVYLETQSSRRGTIADDTDAVSFSSHPRFVAGLGMSADYAKYMRDFFEMSSEDLPPEDLARAFARHFITEGRNPQVHNLPIDHLYNISVLSVDTPLSFLTKRVPLIADTTLLTHFREARHLVYSFGDTPAAWGADRRDTRCYLRCPSLSELGAWLRSCRLLLCTGELFYTPDLLFEEYTETRYDDRGSTEEVEKSVASLCDVVVRNRQLADTDDHAAPLKHRLIQPLLRVELPYVENVDLATFSTISVDHHGALERFRDALRRTFLDLDAAQRSEDRDARIRRAEIDIRDSIRALQADYVALRRTAAFQVSGAAVATTVATLASVNSVMFSSLPQVVGAGGGALLFLKAMLDLQTARRRLEESPYYFLWLFSK